MNTAAMFTKLVYKISLQNEFTKLVSISSYTEGVRRNLNSILKYINQYLYILKLAKLQAVNTLTFALAD